MIARQGEERSPSVGQYEPRFSYIQKKRDSHIVLMPTQGHMARKPKPTIECDKLWKAYDEELIQNNKQKYIDSMIKK